MIETIDHTRDLDLFLKSYVSNKRIVHCKNTALLAQSLSVRFASDPTRGYIAGMLHDIARELDPERIKKLSREDGLGISPREEAHPILLHGRAGATIIQKNLDIQDIGILDAVRFHTSGHPGMDTLACIVYIADFLESGRNYKDIDERENILKKDILDMMIFVTEHKFGYLRGRDRTATEPAIRMYEELKMRRDKRDSL